MKSIAQYLEGHPFFQGLGQEALGTVADCARNIHLPAGTVVISAGEPADTFFVVRHGRVAIELNRPAGGPVVLDSAHDGDIVGWSWLIPPHRWKFDARTTEPTSLVALDGACLRRKGEQDPALAHELLLRVAEVMDRRLQSARVRLLDLYGAGT